MTTRAILPLRYEDSANFKRLAFAAAVVLAAHVALAATYLVRPWPQPQLPASAPAAIIELTPLPAAPASVSDVAPGPEMVEHERTAAPAPPVDPAVVELLPKAETPAQITFALPKPRPLAQQETRRESAPVVRNPEPVRAERQPPAPRTSAAPRFEQRTAPVARAPSPGNTAGRAAIASWRDLVAARLQQSKRYPNGAASRREQGAVTLSFSVNRNGRVLSRRIARSSGYSELDREVLAMIERAQPLPPFPPAMTQSVVHLSVPVHFSLR